jgi:hypothetical protein
MADYSRYYAKVEELAERLGVRNPIGENGKRSLDVDDLTIAALKFYDYRGRLMTTIPFDSMKKGGFLFFQQFANKGERRIPLRNGLMPQAMEDYFQELWQEPPNPARTLISALRADVYEDVELVMK